MTQDSASNNAPGGSPPPGRVAGTLRITRKDGSTADVPFTGNIDAARLVVEGRVPTDPQPTA